MNFPPYRAIPVSNKSPQFPSFLQGFNQRWFARNCQMIYLCYTDAGVAEALEEAITRYGDKVRIKSGGHCYENFVFNEDTLAIIDVTPLAGYGYDNNLGYYLDSGGTNWTAFQNLFRDFGKVLPAGSCYSVGLGGHICGGGYGLLSRLNGLTIDWLTAVDVVVKDRADQPARLVHVSRDSIGFESDLFWASTGGGGGNFGVITRYYFKELPDAPQNALISTYTFKWADLNVQKLYDLLAWYANFAQRRDNWNQFGLFKLMHASAGSIQLVIQTAYNDLDIWREEVDRQTEELAQICPHEPGATAFLGHGSFPLNDAQLTTYGYTYYEATQTLNGSGPNQRGKYKSAYMRKGFPMEQVAAIYQFLNEVPTGLTSDDMKQSLLQVDSYGGAVNQVDTSATAIPQRSSILKLQYQTYWPEANAAQDSGHLDWINRFYEAVYAQTGKVPSPYNDPTDNVDGCYYNYCDSDLNRIVGEEGALRLYFLQNLDRLIQTKQAWDPNNYFNSAQSIPVR